MGSVHAAKQCYRDRDNTRPRRARHLEPFLPLHHPAHDSAAQWRQMHRARSQSFAFKKKMAPLKGPSVLRRF
jgi:hypothetical protein